MSLFVVVTKDSCPLATLIRPVCRTSTRGTTCKTLVSLGGVCRDLGSVRRRGFYKNSIFMPTKPDIGAPTPTNRGLLNPEKIPSGSPNNPKVS